MMSVLLPITVHIGAAKSITNAPWYVIVDTAKIKQLLQRTMEAEELSNINDLDDDLVESIVFDLARGPFFSYVAAEKALPLVEHRCYMRNPKIYEVSGWPNPEYEHAYKQAMKEHREGA